MLLTIALEIGLSIHMYIINTVCCYAITALYEFNGLIIQHKSYDNVKKLQIIIKRWFLW